jgi:sugar transferase (PEP-CTERM system associated)
MFIFNNRYIPYRNLVCFITESLAIFLSVIASYAILNRGWGNDIIQMNDIIIRGVIIAVSAQFCMYILDLYDLNITLSLYDILFSVIFTTGFIFIFIGIFSMVFPPLGIGGGMYYLSGLFIFVFLLFWRAILEAYIEKNTPSNDILIFGTGKIADEVAKLTSSSRRLGFNFLGFIDSNAKHASNADSNFPVFDFNAINSLINSKSVTTIVVAPMDRRRNLPIREMLELKVGGLQVIEWPAFYEKMSGKIPVHNLPPSYFVFNEGFQNPMLFRLFSGVVSFIVAISSMILLAPIFLIVSVLIKMDTKGPVFYYQKRVGLHNKIFNLIKFRTMIEDAEKETGAIWAESDDARITRVGRYLRKYRIDEIPQLINVLKGDMNLIGPRPERPEFVGILEKELPYYKLRLSIRPGVTGWAQVKFSYCGTIEESREKLEYDLFYVKNKSVKLDLYIFFKTIKSLLLARGSR